MKNIALLLFLCTVHSYGEDVQEYVGENHIYRDVVKFLQGCGNREFSLCFKERALQYIENLPQNLNLGGGFQIKANNDREDGRTSKQHSSIALPDDPKEREQAIDNALIDRVGQFAKSHRLEYRFLEETENDLEEGRKKKGGGGGGLRLRSMMMLLQLKIATIGAIALKFIGLVAFKALLVAKIALTIASIVALKKLVEQKDHRSTYEVLAHPHYDDHHYDRSFDLPYKGYGGARSGN